MIGYLNEIDKIRQKRLYSDIIRH